MLVQRFAYLALVGGLWAVRSMSVERVLTMWALAVLGSVALSGSWIWIRSQPAAIDMRTLTTQWTSNVKKGVRALVTISVTLVLVRCDVWMLGPILGVQAVGQVSIASSLAEWLWYVPSILGNLLFAAAAAGTGDHTVRQITRASRAVVTLVVPTTVVLMLLGRHVVPLIYGEAFRPAGTLFVILLPGMAAVAIHLVVDAYFSGKGFPPISVWSAIGALVAKVGLNVLVIHKYGMVGAVAVTSTVYIGLLGVKLVAFAWETGTSPRAVLVPRWDELLGNIAAARSWVLGRLRAA